MRHTRYCLSLPIEQLRLKFFVIIPRYSTVHRCSAHCSSIDPRLPDTVIDETSSTVPLRLARCIAMCRRRVASFPTTFHSARTWSRSANWRRIHSRIQFGAPTSCRRYTCTEKNIRIGRELCQETRSLPPYVSWTATFWIFVVTNSCHFGRSIYNTRPSPISTYKSWYFVPLFWVGPAIFKCHAPWPRRRGIKGRTIVS